MARPRFPGPGEAVYDGRGDTGKESSFILKQCQDTRRIKRKSLSKCLESIGIILQFRNQIEK